MGRRMSFCATALSTLATFSTASSPRSGRTSLAPASADRLHALGQGLTVCALCERLRRRHDAFSGFALAPPMAGNRLHAQPIRDDRVAPCDFTDDGEPVALQLHADP